jgi:cation diffusion facilitator CzcD-associated flavoprotein CzcO
VEHSEVVIVGAGISGVTAGVKLLEAGIDDFVLLERADRFGGTWRANTYPGCACDVPSALYSFSFCSNPDWSRGFARQPEILQYVEGVAESRGLRDHTRFGVDVLDARWSSRDALWTIETSAGSMTSRFLVGAAGPWNEPLVPGIPGLTTFEGDWFHSSRWDHGVDLVGKNVVVIGTGASAVQFVPEIQRAAARVELFQRTAQWVLPKPDFALPGAIRRLMRVPLAARVVRAVENAVMEGLGIGFRRPRPLMLGLQAVGRAHLAATVRDPELRAKLTPDYLIGCKRLLLSNDYYPALSQPNVGVHPTAVAKVRGGQVVGADGTTVDADVIILGTGFHITDMPIAGHVRDDDGKSLDDHWQGSPEAYLGTVVTGFPNLFLLLGPNAGNAHNSAFRFIEAQADLAVKVIRESAAGGWRAVEVRPEVQAAYNEGMQRDLAGTVYNAGACRSYYLDVNGRNSTLSPWSTRRTTRRIRAFHPEDYLVS